jgi:hypothetical protein
MRSRAHLVPWPGSWHLVPRGRHVDADLATVDIGTVHVLDSVGSGVRCVEGDEAETAAAPGLAIHNDLGVDDGAGSGAVEGLAQGLVGGGPGEVSDDCR